MVQRHYIGLLALILILSGCSSNPERIVTRTETVKEPVPVFQEIEIPPYLVQKVDIKPIRFSEMDDENLIIRKSDATHLMNVLNELLKKHKALIKFDDVMREDK